MAKGVKDKVKIHFESTNRKGDHLTLQVHGIDKAKSQVVSFSIHHQSVRRGRGLIGSIIWGKTSSQYIEFRSVNRPEAREWSPVFYLRGYNEATDNNLLKVPLDKFHRIVQFIQAFNDKYDPGKPAVKEGSDYDKYLISKINLSKKMKASPSTKLIKGWLSI